jgi:hypothetical protein
MFQAVEEHLMVLSLCAVLYSCVAVAPYVLYVACVVTMGVHKEL